jgi:hypothetical protein
LALNAAVLKTGTDIPLYVYYLIAQKTVRRFKTHDESVFAFSA